MIDYQEELEQYQERIDELAKEKRYAELRDLFLPMEPADIALLLEEGKQEQMPLLYRLLPKETAAEVFVELEPESQEMLINGFSNTELTEVLDELYLDDAVDIVEEMPASVVIRILDKATPEMRKSINEILKYPEDSAGSIMNMEFLSLKKDMTVEDAFKRPPYRRRAGNHQHPVRHRSHPAPAGRAVRPRPAAGGRGRPDRGDHGPGRGVGQDHGR